MKRKMILVTDSYPFGFGESFLEAEIDHLSSAFSLTVVSSAVTDTCTRRVGPGIRVVRYAARRRTFSKVRYLLDLVLYVFSREGRDEIRDIVRGGSDIGRRFLASLVFFSASEAFYRWIKKRSLIPVQESALVYFYWSNYKTLGLARHRHKYPKVAMITRMHGYDLFKERRREGRQPFKEFMDRKLDALYFASEYGMAYYFENFQVLRDNRHRLSCLGTLRPTVIPRYEGSEVFHLVSCSNVLRIKRVNLIIDALASLSAFSVNWQHFGGGVDFEEIRAYAEARLADCHNIHYTFHGVVPNQEILCYYGNHHVDCFITTSSTEGGNPVSIMEALSFGIPVVATAVGGITEMLLNTSNILLSPTPEVGEIVDALISVKSRDHNSAVLVRESNRLLWRAKYCAQDNFNAFVASLPSA